ncbi:MAG TPA: 50S ribosomal protein L11 methyltransferase [Polyangiaceae bacterium]
MKPTDAEREAFVREQTAPAPVPLVPEISIHTASAVTPLWFATARWLDDHQADVPFWSVPWAGGQGLARYVLDHPECVQDARVLDFGTGSGLVAIAAARAGAASVTAVDVDALAGVAARVNAEANGAAIDVRIADLVGTSLAAFDVVLAGDIWYERAPSHRFARWLRRAVKKDGVRVLTADPGRLHVPRRVRELARYEVPVPFELESVEKRITRVLALDV